MSISDRSKPARPPSTEDVHVTADALRRDRELLARWSSGDVAAGSELLDHYVGFVRKVALRAGVRAGAEFDEFWQDLVVRLLEQLPDLSNRLRTSFAGYLGWQVRDLMRSWRRRERRAGIPTEELTVVHHDEPGDRLAFWEALRSCAAGLPPREQAVFEHRFLGGLDLGEVAVRVESNANAVAQAVFRLVRRLRECLLTKGFDGPGDLS